MLACGDDVASSSDAGERSPAHALDAASSQRSATKESAERADAGKPRDAAAASEASVPAERAKDGGDKGSDAEKPRDNSKAPEDKPKSDSKPDNQKPSNNDPQPTTEKLSIRFRAKVGKTDFACGQKYPSQGTANSTVTPRDLRLFVHAVQLIQDDGATVPVALNVREPWQSDALALLDFEDNTGRCSDGTAGTNTALTGTVPSGSYKGITFQLGVPQEQNHRDPASAVEPLKSAAGLGPTGGDGYRFARVALTPLMAAGASGSALLDLSSTGCKGSGAAADVKCDKPNRSRVTFETFDVAKNEIVIDAAALFSQLDLTQAQECHATEKLCEPMFRAVGLDFATGQPREGQTFFRVE